MKVINDWLCQILGVRGIMIFPFAIARGTSKFYTKAKQEETLTHEYIHFKQCLECLIVFFYPLYLFYHLTKGYDKNPFEVDAFKYQSNINNRPAYAWARKKK